MPNKPAEPSPEVAPTQEQLLSAKLDGDRLVISIGYKLLCFAVSQSPGPIDGFRIVDERKFVEELAKELLSDDEDGHELINDALDHAALRVLEGGSYAVEEINAKR